MGNNSKKLIFGIAAILIIIASAFWLFTGNTKTDKIKTTWDMNDTALKNGNAMTLNIISKTGDSKDFFDYAKEAFMKKYPDVVINFKGMSTFDAKDYVIEHDDMDGWLCADEAAIDILSTEYKKAHPGKEIIESSTPIVITPLVYVGWEERLGKLKDVDTKYIYDIVAKGKSWSEIGGNASWGFFNFCHTDPVQSNSGMQFLMLLTYNYYAQAGTPKKVLSVGDVANSKVMEYIKAFEKNTQKQPEGSGKFIDSMVQYGPSKYDLGAIYEYYALSNIKNAQGRWGKLKVYYPKPTVLSTKPFTIFKGNNVEKIKVLKKFRDYLLSDEIQKLAIKEGYRPANINVSDLSYLENEFASYGFKKEITDLVEKPSQEVINSLQNLSKRIQ